MSLSEGRRAAAFWVTAPGRGELREEGLPELRSGEVRVRALYSAVSRGTESLVFRGAVPESERLRMRCPFQAGDFPAPVKYGYSSVGVVEEGPDSLLGRAVFCLHPHQTRYQVPAEAVRPLPEGVPPERAVLGANMETAVNGLWDAAPRVGDRIAVVGGGALGCLLARLAVKIPGCRVELIDVNPSRARIADALGVAFRTPAAATPGADLVLHTSGSPAGLVGALGLAGFEATVLELSWYGDRQVPLPLGEGFHNQRLTLRSSQVGSVAAARRARWDPRSRMGLALRLLADPALDALITGEDGLADLPAVLARLSEDPGDTICHRIRYAGHSAKEDKARE